MTEAKRQKDAVYDITKEVLAENNVEFEDKRDIIREVILPNSDMKKTISSRMYDGFTNGTIQIRDTFTGDLKSYANSVVTNWFKKDRRFNGDIQHRPLNPGTKSIGYNKTIREVQKMLAKWTNKLAEEKTKYKEADESEIPTIDENVSKINKNIAEIEETLNELIATHEREKAAKHSVNVEAIPEHLRHLANPYTVTETEEASDEEPEEPEKQEDVDSYEDEYINNEDDEDDTEYEDEIVDSVNDEHIIDELMNQ